MDDHSRCHFLFLETCFFVLFAGHLEASGTEIRGDGRRFSGVIGGRWRPEENGMAAAERLI